MYKAKNDTFINGLIFISKGMVIKTEGWKPSDVNFEAIDDVDNTDDIYMIAWNGKEYIISDYIVKTKTKAESKK